MKRMLALALLIIAPGLVQAGALEDLPQYSRQGEQLHASGQPAAEAFVALRKAGLQVVIDLRPASERPQLDEKAVAEAAGLEYESLPVAGRAGLTRDNVIAFDALLRRHAAQNTLAHCSTSNRVGALLALRAAWLQGKPAAEALKLGEQAGLKGLKPDVEALLAPATPGT
jgi:uncharacterized protein (TIGR01244 family)